MSELVSLMPRQMRAPALDAQSLPLVSQSGHVFTLQRFESGQLQTPASVVLPGADSSAQRTQFVTALQRMAGGQRGVALVLPVTRVLRKTLQLPLATEENLQQVLEFQMEDHTPFPAASLYVGYQVLSRDFENGRLQVEFVATPRDEVDAAIKTLTDWGAKVRAVFAEDTLSSDTLVNMLPAEQGKAPFVFGQGLTPWLLGLTALLAVAAMAAPVLIKREAAVQLLPWLDKGKKAAEAADNLKRSLEARVDEHNYLLEKRQQLPPVIMLLEELTRILPDDTWVQQLDIKGKELQIQGETSSSVRLIGLFEQSSMFYDASFRSSLTKGQTPGAERYQLAIRIKPMTAASAPAVGANPAMVPAAQQAASAAAMARLASSAAAGAAPTAPGSKP